MRLIGLVGHSPESAKATLTLDITKRLQTSVFLIELVNNFIDVF